MKNRLYDRGVTLVEVLISLVILLIVFMGLLQASLLSIDHNVRNVVRDEAVKIASDEMTVARSIASRTWDDLVDNTGVCAAPLTGVCTNPRDDCQFAPLFPVVAQRLFRNQAQPYAVRVRVDDLDTNIKQVTIRVRYSYRGEQEVCHTINSTVRR